MKDIDTEFKLKILEVIYKNCYRIPYPVFLANLYIVYATKDHHDHGIVIAWFVVVCISIVGRRIYVPVIYNHPKLQVDKKLKYIQFLTLSNGITMAIFIVFFSWMTLIDQALVTMLFVGLCTGAIFSTASYKPILRSFVLPVMFALILHWLFGAPELDTANGIFISGLVLIYTVVLFSFGEDIFALYRDSYLLSAEQSRLNMQLSKALKNEEKANRSKTRFLAAASHDLRQPLNAMSLYTTALALQNLDKKSDEITTQLSKALNLLSAQMDSLLDISKLDAGITSVKNEIIALGPLLSEIKSEYEPQAAQKGLEIILNTPEPILINTDSIQFGRILRNLMSNSIKFTSSGRIHLRTERHDDHFIIRLTDTGQGISEDELDNIFDEFYQIKDPQDSDNRGLGLGLSIVRRLCDLLDIEINIESTLDMGTTISLKLSAEHVNEYNDTPVEGSQIQHDMSIFGGLTILVVDDEESNREGMSLLLTDLGSIVFAASNTNEALDQANKVSPDLLLVDYRLSGNSTGLETIREIHQRYPSLPAVLVTGGVDDSSQIEAANENIPIIIKPLSLNLLREIVAGLL